MVTENEAGRIYLIILVKLGVPFLSERSFCWQVFAYRAHHPLDGLPFLSKENRVNAT